MITLLRDYFDILYSLHKWVQKTVMVFMDNLYFICWKCFEGSILVSCK